MKREEVKTQVKLFPMRGNVGNIACEVAEGIACKACAGMR